MDWDLTLQEWAEELTYALAAGPGAWAMMTVATHKTAAAGQEVVETARDVVAAAGLPVIELDARWVAADPGLLPSEAGYVILHDVGLPLRVAVPVLIGGFQHLVGRGLLVGILVIGSPAGIRALRQEPSMGFISRAEVLEV
ncbi:hypothetical protein [Arthrobacter sp. SO3]|uniref:hypothetical protein n=1 Tax=Arthrobacter sp. SO3 TaxID=1897057 RepID=UPI001CFFC65E|nr:hypothetical protein [Arthrobacter sp. SO3]